MEHLLSALPSSVVLQNASGAGIQPGEVRWGEGRAALPGKFPPWGFVLVGERRDQALGGWSGRAFSGSDPLEEKHQQRYHSGVAAVLCQDAGGGGVDKVVPGQAATLGC